jgi:hypothetical protein
VVGLFCALLDHERAETRGSEHHPHRAARPAHAHGAECQSVVPGQGRFNGSPGAASPVRAADFDLELIESRTLGSQTQELIYRPTLQA